MAATARTAPQHFRGWTASLTVALVIAGCGGGSPKFRLDGSTDARDAADVRTDAGDARTDRGDTGVGGATGATDGATDRATDRATDGATDQRDTAPSETGAGGSDASDSGAGGAGSGGAAGSDAGGAGTGGMGSGGMGTGGAGTGGMGTGGMGAGGMGTGGVGTGGTGTGGMGTGGMGTGGTGTGGMGTGGDADAGTDVPADSGGGDVVTGNDTSDASGGGCGVGCPATLRAELPPLWLTADIGMQQCDGANRVTGWANQGSNGGILAPPVNQIGPLCTAATLLGGRPVIGFDAPGSNDLAGVLSIDLNPLLGGNAGYTIFVVERRQSPDEGYFLGTSAPTFPEDCRGNGDGNAHLAYRFGYDRPVPLVSRPSVLRSGPYIGDDNGDCLVPLAPTAFASSNPQASLDVELFDPSTGHKTFSDGRELISDADVDPVDPFTDGFIGRAFQAQEVGTRHSRFKGDIAEIVIYAAALTQTEIDLVSSYLANRWGLPH